MNSHETTAYRRLKDLPQAHLLAAGTSLCAGCGGLQAIHQIQDVLGPNTVFVNAAHPAYRRAVASRSEGYHVAVAVAMALAPEAVEPSGVHGFIGAFLSAWREALGRDKRRRGALRPVGERRARQLAEVAQARVCRRHVQRLQQGGDPRAHGGREAGRSERRPAEERRSSGRGQRVDEGPRAQGRFEGRKRGEVRRLEQVEDEMIEIAVADASRVRLAKPS